MSEQKGAAAEATPGRATHRAAGTPQKPAQKPGEQQASESLMKLQGSLDTLSRFAGGPLGSNQAFTTVRVYCDGAQPADMIQICESTNFFEALLALLNAPDVPMRDLVQILEIMDHSFSCCKTNMEEAMKQADLIPTIANSVLRLSFKEQSDAHWREAVAVVRFMSRLLYSLVSYCEGALQALLERVGVKPFRQLLTKTCGCFSGPRARDSFDWATRDALLSSVLFLLNMITATGLSQGREEVQDSKLLKQVCKILLAQFGNPLQTPSSPRSDWEGCEGRQYISIESTRLAVRLASLMVQFHEGNQDLVLGEGVAAAVVPLAKFMPDKPQRSQVKSEEEQLHMDAVAFFASLRHDREALEEDIRTIWHRHKCFPPFQHSQLNWDFMVLCFECFDDITQDTDDIKMNPWDAQEIGTNMHRLRASFNTPHARHMASHMPLFFRSLVQCISNIDETIMQNSLACAYSFLLENPAGQEVFLEQAGTNQAGLWALSGSLWDYNVHIKLSALNILVLLASSPTLGGAVLRNELRRCGVLKHVVRICKEVCTADDVTLEVVDAAAGLLAHSLTMTNADPREEGFRANQEYVQSKAGAGSLMEALKHCVDLLELECKSLQKELKTKSGTTANQHRIRAQASKCRPQPTTTSEDTRRRTILFNATENICLALNNLTYHCTAAQKDFQSVGGFDLLDRLLRCSAVLCALRNTNSWDRDLVIPDITPGVANVLVNAVDTNVANQDVLAKESDKWRAHVTHLLSQASPPAHVGVACLLMSHISWNHSQNQLLFGTLENVRTLLDLVEQGMSRRKTTNQEHLQLVLFALLALVNLTYQNPKVQDLAGKLDGIRIVLLPLHFYSEDESEDQFLYELCKTATFCLGNLVKNHPENAKRLGDGGGVMLLVDMLSDTEEDELSKKGFHTLANCGSVGLAHLVACIGETTSEIGEMLRARTVGSDAEAQLMWHMERLGTFLSVINGLIYMSNKACAFMLRSFGISPILNVMRDVYVGVLSARLAGHALHSKATEVSSFSGAVLVNMTINRQPQLQDQACKAGVFEVFESCASAKLALGRAAAGGGAARVGRRAATADPRNRMGRGPPKEDPQNQPCAEEEDLWSSMYAIVLNLVLDNQPNLGRLLRADNFVAKLILDVGRGLGLAPGQCQPDLLSSALELLLHACDQCPPQARTRLLKLTPMASELTVLQLVGCVARKQAAAGRSLTDATVHKAQAIMSRLTRIS